MQSLTILEVLMCSTGTRWVGVLLLCGAMSGCVMQRPEIAQTTTESRNIDSGIAADPEIEELIQGYKEQLDNEMYEVIGEAATDLNNGSGTVESALGNFVADLMLAQSTKHFGSHIDLALINARGGLRVPISKGDITVGKVFELMPFDNEVWVMELTGAQTQKLFDHCALTKRMALSGARYQMQGAQAVGILIGDASFDEEQSYLLAVPDFLATGGDRFDFLPQAKLVKKLNYLVRNMIINHIRLLSQKSILIEARLDGRVTELP